MSLCPECGGIDNELCQCAVCDSDCFEVLGSGNDGQPFVVAPKIDPDPDNILIRDDGFLAVPPTYILNPPRCNVFHTITQSIPDDNATVLLFNDERYDTDNMHPGTTTKITFNTAGIYYVTLQFTWDINDDGDRAGFIRKNGADFIALDSKHAAVSAFTTTHNLSAQESFAEGDYVEAVVKQDSGGSLNVLSNRRSPVMAATFRRRSPTT